MTMLKSAVAALGVIAATAVVSTPAFAAGVGGLDGVKASSDFAYKYEADVLPTADPLGFVLQDPQNVVSDAVSLSSGVLTIDTVNNANGDETIWYELTGPNWAPAPHGGYTLEIRALVRNTNNSNAGFSISMEDASSWGVVELFDTEGVQIEDTVIPTPINSDQFHVFRIATYSTDGASANQRFVFYRDGVQLGGEVVASGAVTSPILRFGDYPWGSAEANIDIDYIRWDTSGAWAPVPEPTTMGLLLGGAALITLRRKR